MLLPIKLSDDEIWVRGVGLGTVQISTVLNQIRMRAEECGIPFRARSFRVRAVESGDIDIDAIFDLLRQIHPRWTA